MSVVFQMFDKDRDEYSVIKTRENAFVACITVTQYSDKCSRECISSSRVYDNAEDCVRDLFAQMLIDNYEH